MWCGIIYFHSRSLQKMRTVALMKRFRDRTLVRMETPQQRDWATIGLAEVIPTISVLALGVLASLLILALECHNAGLEWSSTPCALLSTMTTFLWMAVQWWLRNRRGETAVLFKTIEPIWHATQTKPINSYRLSRPYFIEMWLFRSSSGNSLLLRNPNTHKPVLTKAWLWTQPSTNSALSQLHPLFFGEK